jgi:hypothetical protein
VNPPEGCMSAVKYSSMYATTVAGTAASNDILKSFPKIIDILFTFI